MRIHAVPGKNVTMIPRRSRNRKHFTLHMWCRAITLGHWRIYGEHQRHAPPCPISFIFMFFLGGATFGQITGWRPHLECWRPLSSGKSWIRHCFRDPLTPSEIWSVSEKDQRNVKIVAENFVKKTFAFARCEFASTPMTLMTMKSAISNAPHTHTHTHIHTHTHTHTQVIFAKSVSARATSGITFVYVAYIQTEPIRTVHTVRFATAICFL